MTGRRARGVATAAAAALLLVGCGVPENATLRRIDRETVPYRLLEEAPAAAPAPETTPTGPAVTVPQVYFVDQEDRLVPQAQPLGAQGLFSVATSLLSALAAGPTEDQRARGLATALGPDVGLRLAQVTNGVASVEIALSEQGPVADRLPLAIGQLVLSVTSVDGIDAVRLLQNGEPVEAPLPGGERTSEPLVPSDYVTLLTPSAARVQQQSAPGSTGSAPAPAGSPTGR